MDEKKRDDDHVIELGDRRPQSHIVDAEPKPAAPTMHTPGSTSITNSPMASILCYCGSSILMTCANKYVVNGTRFNLPFFLGSVQATVCILAISISKAAGLITYRDFEPTQARKWLPIAVLLIGMIYTSMKALQFLSVPVYTIFKNLTIILIAYGEVLWFGGSVTGMSLVSFGLMVLSSVIAAWADIQHALQNYGGDALSGEAAEKISTLNAGYMWMLFNCFCSATFVLGMRKRIKLTNFKDFDTMFYNNLLSLPILLTCSLFLENWSSANLAQNFPDGERTYMIGAMVFTGLSSIFISYASAWCVRVTSSTTYSMVGALNKLPIAISGLVFFDAPVTFGSVGAIGVGFISGVVYAVAKVWQKEKETGQASSLPTSIKMPVSASVKSMRDSFKS